MSLVRHALNSRWLEEPAVACSYGGQAGGTQREDHLDQAALRAEVSSEALAKEEGPSLIGTALSGLPAVASAKEGAVEMQSISGPFVG